MNKISKGLILLQNKCQYSKHVLNQATCYYRTN